MALKTFNPRGYESSSLTVSGLSELFLHEARALALIDHPHVVPIPDPGWAAPGINNGLPDENAFTQPAWALLVHGGASECPAPEMSTYGADPGGWLQGAQIAAVRPAPLDLRTAADGRRGRVR